MQTLCKLVFVIGLLLWACGCSDSRHISENHTDTIRVTFKRILPEQEVSDTASSLLLIREKSDSILKFTYQVPNSDSSRLLYFTFESKDDSLTLVDQAVSNDSVSKANVFPLVGFYQSQEDKSIKLYKYERPESSMMIGQAYVFSNEYGMIAMADYFWGQGIITTHWNNKAIPDAYTKLVNNNKVQIFTKKLTIPNLRMPAK